MKSIAGMHVCVGVRSVSVNRKTPGEMCKTAQQDISENHVVTYLITCPVGMRLQRGSDVGALLEFISDTHGQACHL